MASKRKYPFHIACRNCNSNNVTVRAFDYHELEIKCNSCGTICDCGMYEDGHDYSEMTTLGSKNDDWDW